MRDPHIVSLRYQVVPVEGVSFKNAPPLSWETDAFRMELRDEIATFELNGHFASEQEARKQVESYLEAWKVHSALQTGRSEIAFDFLDTDMIERSPPAHDTRKVAVGGSMATVSVSAGGAGIAVRMEYPPPPHLFAVTSDVRVMFLRYQDYREGRAHLGVMAYACLTRLEQAAGTRREAARLYKISKKVLATLAELSTQVGDERTVRKFSKGVELRPYTPHEKRWLEAAVRAIIKRVGEHGYGPNRNWPLITMEDLPPLC